MIIQTHKTANPGEKKRQTYLPKILELMIERNITLDVLYL